MPNSDYPGPKSVDTVISRAPFGKFRVNLAFGKVCPRIEMHP
jgi:hypothetical protein